MAHRVPTLVNQLMTFVIMHELGHAIGGRHHELQRFLKYQFVGATPEAQKADGQRMQEECYSSGDHACIMRYWHYDDDQSEVLLFLAGAWDPKTPLDGGNWIFCEAEDKPFLHIKP